MNMFYDVINELFLLWMDISIDNKAFPYIDKMRCDAKKKKKLQYTVSFIINLWKWTLGRLIINNLDFKLTSNQAK